MIVLPLHDILRISLENLQLVSDNPRSPRCTASSRQAALMTRQLSRSSASSLRRAVSLDEVGAFSRWTSTPSTQNAQFTAVPKSSNSSAAAIGRKLLERSSRKMGAFTKVASLTSSGTRAMTLNSFEVPPRLGPPLPPTTSHADSTFLRKPMRSVSPHRSSRNSLLLNDNITRTGLESAASLGNFRKTQSLTVAGANGSMLSRSRKRGQSGLAINQGNSNFQWAIPVATSGSGMRLPTRSASPKSIRPNNSNLVAP